MKWGVRKANKSGSSKKKKPAKAKTMTTKDLKSKTDRLKLERDYTQLTQKKKNRAKIIGAAVLTAVATTAATLLVKHYGTKGLKALDTIPSSIKQTPLDEAWDNMRTVGAQYLKNMGMN